MQQYLIPPNRLPDEDRIFEKLIGSVKNSDIEFIQKNIKLLKRYKPSYWFIKDRDKIVFFTDFDFDQLGRLHIRFYKDEFKEVLCLNLVDNSRGVSKEYIKISQRTTSNKTFDTYFYYDGLGNFIQFKKPADGGQQIVKNFFYDGMGRVSAESNPYFASSGTGLTTTQNSDFSNYTYDTLSRVITVRNPDENVSTVKFDHWNITAYDENNHRKMYSTDAYGRIVNVLEYNNDPVLKFNFETDTYTTTYNYDASDNLVKITDALGNNFIFGYDSLGRRISLQDPDMGNWSYTYDLTGNLIKQVQNGGGNLVTGDGFYREYNELNQLTIIRNGSTATSPQLENYTYDPFGQRIKIMRNDSANTTVYTPFKELMRIVNSSGTYDFTYVYDGNTLVARVNPDGSKYYYHPDHLGSTSLITDQNGNVVENTFYSPYGELLSGGTSEDKLYTGQFADDTGQYYYGERYYKAGTVQFIQVDDNLNIYNPQGLNAYSYTLNNPYRYTDESGEIPVPIITGAIGAAIGGGINLGVQLWQNNGDLSKVSWSEVGVSAVAGGVAGATFGAGTAVLGTGFGASVLSGAGAGIAGGQTGIAGGNVISGRGLTEGLFRPEDMVLQGGFGAVGSGLGYGAGKIITSVASKGMNPFTKQAIQYGNEQHKQLYSELGPQGFKTNQAIPGTNGKLRPDAYDPITKTVVELKPNNPAGTNLGKEQLAKYKSALEKFFGGEWKIQLRTYQPLKKG